jgi:hypothetical protein
VLFGCKTFLRLLPGKGLKPLLQGGFSILFIGLFSTLFLFSSRTWPTLNLFYSSDTSLNRSPAENGEGRGGGGSALYWNNVLGPSTFLDLVNDSRYSTSNDQIDEPLKTFHKRIRTSVEFQILGFTGISNSNGFWLSQSPPESRSQKASRGSV